MIQNVYSPKSTIYSLTGNHRTPANEKIWNLPLTFRTGPPTHFGPGIRTYCWPLGRQAFQHFPFSLLHRFEFDPQSLKFIHMIWLTTGQSPKKRNRVQTLGPSTTGYYPGILNDAYFLRFCWHWQAPTNSNNNMSLHRFSSSKLDGLIVAVGIFSTT